MFKYLLPRIREYKSYAILTPILMIGEVWMEVLIPYIMALIVDRGISNGDIEYVFVTSLYLVLVSLLSLLFGAMAAITASKASAGFARNIRSDLYDKLLTFSFANIDYFSPSSLITRMTTDVQYVQQAFQMMIRMCFRAPIMFVFAILMVYNTGGSLTMVFLFSVPVLALAISYLVRKSYPIFGKVFENYDRLNLNTQENLNNIRTVKAYVREKEEIEKFNKTSLAIRLFFTRAQKLMVLNSPVMMTVSYISLLIICYLGAGYIAEGSMQTGTLMSIFSYTMQIMSSLMMIAMIVIMFAISKASVKRIVEVLKTTSDMDENENGIKEVKSGDIDFECVNFSYGNKEDSHCLEDINLKIKAGTTLGILGQTGSGKTTLVSLIARLYDINSGFLKVGGIDVRDYNLKALRDKVSIVLQKNQLFSGTIRSNLLWGNELAGDDEIKAALVSSNADFVLNSEEGLDGKVEQGGNNFSGGQKQRLCIARALLKKPRILIFDDSTSAVDTATDLKIRKALRENVTDCTKIIIAQRVQSVMDADQIIIMKNGKIESMGNHEELLAHDETYRNLWETQIREKE